MEIANKHKLYSTVVFCLHTYGIKCSCIMNGIFPPVPIQACERLGIKTGERFMKGIF